MKYTIIASALAGNKGAASMLEASVQLLSEEEDAELVLLSVYPDQDRELNTYDNLEIVRASPLYLGLVINPLSILHRLFPFARNTIERVAPPVRHIAESGALLDQGGITFSDGREKFLIFNVASILPALVLGVPVVKCAQAVGPFEGRLNRLVSKGILPRVHLIVARGEKTRANLAKLGLVNTLSGVDLAFAMAVQGQAKESAEARFSVSRFTKSDHTVIGISPSQVVKSYVESKGIDYVNLMSEFVNLVLDDPQNKVIMIPHSVRPDSEKTHNNDLPLCREIVDRIQDPEAKNERCLFVDEEASAQELRYVIGHCDVFVASRFHAMISALATEVPPLVIGWSHKYGEVLKMFDLESSFLPYEAMQDAHEMVRLLNQQIDRAPRTRRQIRRHLPEIVTEAKRHKDYVQAAAHHQELTEFTS